MKKIALILISIFFFAAISRSQESYIKNRLAFKLGYANYQTNTSSESAGTWKYNTTGNYQFEVDYGVLNFIESGIYVGYSSWFGNSLYTYGGNINVHILPFIIQAKDFRFDAYLTGKVGGSTHRFEFLTISNNTHNNMLEYGVGMGGAFYLFKHFGVFAEYSLGKYFFIDNKKFRVGLSFKFKK